MERLPPSTFFLHFIAARFLKESILQLESFVLFQTIAPYSISQARSLETRREPLACLKSSGIHE